MMITLDELIKEAKHVAARVNMDISEGHPEDLVANLVPILEGIAAGYALGFMNRQDAHGCGDKTHTTPPAVLEPDQVAFKH